MTKVPLTLAIRRREPQGTNSSPTKEKEEENHPVIAHTESAQSEIAAVEESKNGKKEKQQQKKNSNETNKVVAAPAAVAERFTAQYGGNFTGLEPWVRLCRDLGVQGPLNSKTQCKKALQHIHVNIRDFLDAIDARAHLAACYYAANNNNNDPLIHAAILNTPLRVRFFDSEWSLSAYTLANHRVYPRREIFGRNNQEGGGGEQQQQHPLRLLMKHIRYPRGGKARRGAIGC